MNSFEKTDGAETTAADKIQRKAEKLFRKVRREAKKYAETTRRGRKPGELRSNDVIVFVMDDNFVPNYTNTDRRVHIGLPSRTTAAELEQLQIRLVTEKFAVECPCCDRLLTTYLRPITVTMAKCFIIFAVYSEQMQTEREKELGIYPEIHLVTMLHRLHKPGNLTGDFAKLRYMGLIEPGGEDPNNPESGKYRLTQTGQDWLRGKCRVPKGTRVFKNKCIGLSEQDTSLQEALAGPKFDYVEMVQKRGFEKFLEWFNPAEESTEDETETPTESGEMQR